ncbi:MAG: hypothetical protein ACPG8W_14660, partial [Candidatus Promineifilaceae bacterium]
MMPSLKRLSNLSATAEITSLLVGCILLVLLLYPEALWLPYFFDDLDHVPFAMENSFGTIWRSPGGFPYFRPLGVSALRLVGRLFGASAFAHHAFNLILHALNGFLVGLIAGRLNSAEKHPRAILAATLFILFPFSYQAVPWVDAVYHLITTFLLLAALLSYLHYQTSRQRRWAILTVVCLFFAPFAHENGLIGGALVALLALITPTTQRPTHWTPSHFIHAGVWLIPSVCNLLITSAIPSNSRSAVALNGLETLWQNSTYYLQGFIFPISWLGGRIVRAGGNDLYTVWALGAVALLLILLLAKRWHPLYALGLVWFAGGSVLAVGFLNFQYVIDGARLLMVASVGAALFWSQLLVDGWRQRWARPLVGLVSLAAVVANGLFIRDTLNTHRVLGEGFWHVVEETTTQASSSDAVVFVNLLEWAANARLQFAVGHEGAMFRPNYIPAHRIASGLYPTTRPMQFINDPATLPEWDYYFDAINEFGGWEALERKSVDLFQINYSAETVTKQHLGTTNVQLSPSPEPQATFTLADAQIQ